MAQSAAQKDAEWQSNRDEEKKPSLKTRIKAALKKKDEEAEESAARKAPELSKTLAKLPKAKPRFIEPMKPRLMDEPPNGGDWSYELKFDGIRACAIKNGK